MARVPGPRRAVRPYPVGTAEPSDRRACRTSESSLGYAEACPRQMSRLLHQPGKATRRELVLVSASSVRRSCLRVLHAHPACQAPAHGQGDRSHPADSSSGCPCLSHTGIPCASIRTHRQEQSRAQKRCLNAADMAKSTSRKMYAFHRMLNNWVQDTLRSGLFSLFI